jgi:NTE family protein
MLNPSLAANLRHRHQIALVLGSGGVRAIAALGMVDVLRREGIAPDLIVGCSAGAIFAAVIAEERTVPDAIRASTSLWTAELTRQRRWRAVPQMLWPKLCRFNPDFSLRYSRLIEKRLQEGFGDVRLEDMPIPLRISATEAETGLPVVLDKGRVVDAIRASVAMPFMFAPKMVDGRRLIDGYVSDPLPVVAASDARYVIALGFNAPMPKYVNGPSRLLAQLNSSLNNNLMHARLNAAEAGGMRLLRVFPELDRRVSLFDTEAMPYLVEAGRRATEEALPKIWALLERQAERHPEALAA